MCNYKSAFLYLLILGEECTFRFPSFSLIAASPSPSAQLSPFWVGSATGSSLQTSSASFLSICWSGSSSSWQEITYSPTVWLGGFVTPVSCYFIMCCILCHMRVELLVGSMGFINEFCFTANPCLLIDVHMYFSFTCPVLYLCCYFLSHSYLLHFMYRSSWTRS